MYLNHPFFKHITFIKMLKLIILDIEHQSAWCNHVYHITATVALWIWRVKLHITKKPHLRINPLTMRWIQVWMQQFFQFTRKSISRNMHWFFMCSQQCCPVFNIYLTKSYKHMVSNSSKMSYLNSKLIWIYGLQHLNFRAN